MDEQTVVAYRASSASYLSSAPYHPDEGYPEYQFGASVQAEPNPAYAAIRGALQLAGLDRENYGMPSWNPLRDYIRPGQFVLLKPNLVKETHPRDPEGWIYTITHGSVIRAIADYVWKALDGRGRVVVADAPQTDSSFERMVSLLRLDAIQGFYHEQGLPLELLDLRKEEWVNRDEVIVERRRLAGDPHGYVALDLAERSEFAGHGGAGRYYGADYDDGEVNRHHSDGRHEYLVAGSAVHCDVFINVPKLKTHKKSGVTINLKNLVGVNGDKNWLPHHTVGSPRNGGDQFPSITLKQAVEHYSVSALHRVALAAPRTGTWFLRRARRAGKTVFGDTDKVIRSGNWYGNDTVWRMCLDLNKVVLYGNPDGTFREPELGQRKTYLSFVDGIIAGQGDGPMDPDPHHAGVLLFGANPASVDALAATLMGFDIDMVPVIRQAFDTVGFPLAGVPPAELRALSNYTPWNGSLEEICAQGGHLRFRPHFGWAGHIERQDR